MKKFYLLLCIFSISSLNCANKKRLSNLNCPIVPGCTYKTGQDTIPSHCVQAHGKSKKKFFHCPCKGCDKKNEHYKYLKPHIKKTHPDFFKIGALATLHCKECNKRRRPSSAKSCGQQDLAKHLGHSLKLKQMIPFNEKILDEKNNIEEKEQIAHLQALKELVKANHVLITLQQKKLLNKAKK